MAVRFDKNARKIEIRNYHDWCGKILEENGYGREYQNLFKENKMENEDPFKRFQNS